MYVKHSYFFFYVCHEKNYYYYYYYHGLILMKICMNTKFMKPHFFIKLYVYDMKCHVYEMEKFCD